MLVERIIHIQTSIFLPLPNEEDELVNEGAYGKAFCLFLERKLPESGFSVTRYLAEDWGWWVEIDNSVKPLELAIYYSDNDTTEKDYALLLDVRKPSFFSFKKFKRLSREEDINALQTSLEMLMSSTDGIKVVGISEEFPF